MDAVTDRMEELFCAVMEISSDGERKAYLEHACAGDVELRAGVERMLAKHSAVEHFFRENPRDGLLQIADSLGSPDEAGPASTTPEAVGRQIGPYKLLQQIGEGGCGVVYMAGQEVPVRRRVALKVIKLGMDTKSVVARFDAERQALAMMDHPNIARVLDAGATETGRPYFVMELVRGTKITTFCDESHFDTCQRLELFIQICHAIQHAHQKGIIHRDVKPSNILVTTRDGKPVPKVIDFGIAKATSGERLTDLTVFTAYDQFIGTPAYMSPEQAQMSDLDVDTRSDIYSLGVLLYELLTGKTPFDQKELMRSGLVEMRRTLLEQEPHRPSTKLDGLRLEELTRTAASRQIEPPKLKLLLKGDLDWIVMKALEKDRNRRYQTANGLGLDVQRYLQNEPIFARPPSRLYRFQKLVRRNKTLFVAIAIVSLALLAGLCVSTWLLVEEREARRHAVAAEHQQMLLRQESDRLLHAAENREKLSEALAIIAYNPTNFEAADGLIVDIPASTPKLEYADMYRTLGDWHAVNGRWQEAAKRFTVLLLQNQPEQWDVSTLDYLRYGPVLLEAGDLAGYEQFRQSAVAHFAATTNPVPAERVLKVSLLTPPGRSFLGALQPLAETASNSLAAGPGPVASLAAWRAFSLALMDYRCGNYAGVERWHQKSVTYDRGSVVRGVTFEIVLAMTHYQTGETDQARLELAQAQQRIEEQFSVVPLQAGDGFWFDWVFARILLREADALMEQAPSAPK